jgi:hypothetical protein
LPRLSEAEREAHARFIATLGEKAIWLAYRPPPPAPDAERTAAAG